MISLGLGSQIAPLPNDANADKAARNLVDTQLARLRIDKVVQGKRG